MPKITIVLDVTNVDPKLNDPWVVVDEVLSDSMPTFEAGEPFSMRALGIHSADAVEGTFVSAEWSD